MTLDIWTNPSAAVKQKRSIEVNAYAYLSSLMLGPIYSNHLFHVPSIFQGPDPSISCTRATPIDLNIWEATLSLFFSSAILLFKEYSIILQLHKFSASHAPITVTQPCYSQPTRALKSHVL